jgi:hypothetical protein
MDDFQRSSKSSELRGMRRKLEAQNKVREKKRLYNPTHHELFCNIFRRK